MKLTSASGSNYTAQSLTTSAVQYTAYVPNGVSGDVYFQIAINSGSTKPSSKNAQLTIDDVVFTYTPAASGTCSTPTFSPAAGTYEGAQSVTITSTEGATIYYTTDGSAPTTSSNVYTSAISVNANQTIKAFATKTGLTNSEISEAAYTITAGPDVTLNLVDGNWGFPVSGGTTLTSYTNSETGYTVGCYAAAEYKVSGSSYFIIGKANSYILLPEFTSPVEKIVVVGNSGGSSATVFNVYDGNTAVSTAATGCNTDKTFEIENPEANKQYKIQVTSAHNLQLKAIKIYFGEAPAVAAPTIFGDDNFLTSTIVTLDCETDNATIYYTTDGSDPKNGTTYSTSFTLNATTTVKAIAKVGNDWSSVASKTFTKVTPLTVAQARSAIDAGGDLTNKYVSGTISQIDSYNSTYHSITYWISDDGNTTNQLEVYGGLAGVIKSAFESTDDLAVGDDVTVKGTLKKYNSTYEFDKDNMVVAFRPKARLSWSGVTDGEYSADLNSSNTFPTLSKPNGVSVTYSSSNTAAATVNTSTGAISLVAEGQTDITATFAGNENYKANTASYTLYVANSIARGTITYDVDGGEEIAAVPEQTKLPDELPIPVKGGKNFGGWFTDENKTIAAVAGSEISSDITLYALWLEPYTVAEALAMSAITGVYVNGYISTITEVSTNHGNATYNISDDGTTSSEMIVYRGKKQGNQAFTSEDDIKQGDFVIVYGDLTEYNNAMQMASGNYIYSLSREEAAVTGVELDQTTLSIKEGATATLTATVAPANATDNSVTWSSSNEAIATVEDGVVTAVAIGNATITVTTTDGGFTATCAVTVTDPNARNGALAVFRKVTSTAGITDGEYLIVYEDESSAVAFDGALETVDAVGNTLEVTIENDMIVAYDDAAFTIDATAKTIKSYSGYYIGQTSNANGLASNATTTYENTISIDEDGNFVAVSGGAYLRYNSSSNQLRFRYYKSSSYSGQQPIQLYKKVEPASIRDGLSAGKWGTFCPQKKVLLPQGASFYTLTYKEIREGVPYKVFFDEIGEGESLEAGKPYLFIAEGTDILGVETGDNAASAQNYNGFHGIVGNSAYTLTVSQAESDAYKYYIIYQNQIRRCGVGDFTMAVGRAYIDMSEVSANATAPAPGRRRVGMENPEAPQHYTGIDAIESAGKTVKVMIGEQLFILRDGKLYDTTGRLVK
ncbi:MAG: chitobiase/beta-hexosaminidase C-terminal domain-containing protein [Paludibacteraceae bacterium]|nr:chitobiase/beta-hexosaminidase C-terminal domain-containing protein [Paludibacteraceae bacterium]